jgi:WD40 repeat protein
MSALPPSSSDPDPDEVEFNKDLIDAIVLVNQFLESSGGKFSQTAASLREEAKLSGLLPPSTGWDGKPRAGSLPHPRALNALSKDHLLRALRPSSASSSSLISETLKVVETTQLTGMTWKQKRKTIAAEVTKLIELREEHRRLAKEIASHRGRSSDALDVSLRVLATKISLQARVVSPLLLRIVSGEVPSTTRTLLGRQQRPSMAEDARGEDHAPHRLMCSQYRVLKKISGHRGPAYCLATSHNDWIFTGADDGLVRMWDPRTARLQACFRGALFL